ncbi:MAG: N-6 DNA methylase, partial [Saprospiraceae bacterium]
RRNEILFIDARKMGSMISRRHRELTEADILKISGTYHAWRTMGGSFEAVKGFCHAATLDEVRTNNYVLTPGRYVGAEDLEDDGIPFEDKMRVLTGTMAEQFAESARLEQEIRQQLLSIGFKI